MRAVVRMCADMKRIVTILVLCAFGVFLAGVFNILEIKFLDFPNRDAVVETDDTIVVTNSETTQSQTDTADAADMDPTSTVRNDNLLSFEYRYPDSALEIDAVAQWLDQDKEESFADYHTRAGEWRTEAKANGFNFHAYEFSKNWTLTANTPDVYSLAAEVYAFQGGAHGSTYWEVLNWSRVEEDFILTRNMFTAPEQFLSAITPHYCDRLRNMQAEKLGYAASALQNVQARPACPDIAEFPIAPVESGRQGDAIYAFKVYLPQGAAGASAEGDYVVDVPVTTAVTDLARPEYQKGFEASAP